MSRAALGNRDDVRVAVRISGTRKDGSSVVDWAGKREPAARQGRITEWRAVVIARETACLPLVSG